MKIYSIGYILLNGSSNHYVIAMTLLMYLVLNLFYNASLLHHILDS